jgi:hypothetical protein
MAGCSGPATGGFPEQDRQAVLLGCKNGGAPPEICECAVKKIEGALTYAEFKELNTAIEQGRAHPLSARVQAITIQCGEDYLKSGGQ